MKKMLVALATIAALFATGCGASDERAAPTSTTVATITERSSAYSKRDDIEIKLDMSQFGLSRSASEAFFDMAKTTPCFDSSTNVYQRKNLTLAKELIKRESISNDPTDPMAQRLISRVNDRADCA